MKTRSSLTSKQEHWLAHIRACRRSEQSVADYARSQGLAAAQLYTWISRLRALGALPDGSEARSRRPKPNRASPALTFSPIRLIGSAEPRNAMLLRFANGVVLEFNGTEEIDGEFLATLAKLP